MQKRNKIVLNENRYKFSYNNYVFWALAVVAPVCIKIVLNQLINGIFANYLMSKEGITDIVELNRRFADSGMGVMSTGIASFLTLLIVLRLLKMDEINQIGGERYGLHKTTVTKAVCYAIIAIILSVIINYAVNIIFSSAMAGYKMTERVLFSGDLLFRLLVLGIISPICEEYIFRVLVIKRLTIKVKMSTAVVVSAFIFGIYHMNLMQGVYAVMMGLIIGYVYMKEKNILIPVLMHASANITIILLEYCLKV